jgi:transposase-like protein
VTYDNDVKNMGASFATAEIVCPWCGYVHQDSWEVGSDEGTFECHDCEQSFQYARHTTITYATSRS